MYKVAGPFVGDQTAARNGRGEFDGLGQIDQLIVGAVEQQGRGDDGAGSGRRVAPNSPR
jgi:hypothetical protein